MAKCMFSSLFCSHREGSPPNTLLIKGTRSPFCVPLRSQSQIRTSQLDLSLGTRGWLLQSLPPTVPGCSPCSRGHPLVTLNGWRCPPLGFADAGLRHCCPSLRSRVCVCVQPSSYPQGRSTPPPWQGSSKMGGGSESPPPAVRPLTGTCWASFSSPAHWQS